MNFLTVEQLRREAEPQIEKIITDLATKASANIVDFIDADTSRSLTAGTMEAMEQNDERAIAP